MRNDLSASLHTYDEESLGTPKHTHTDTHTRLNISVTLQI